jgi:hypothetical protein
MTNPLGWAICPECGQERRTDLSRRDRPMVEHRRLTGWAWCRTCDRS